VGSAVGERSPVVRFIDEVLSTATLLKQLLCIKSSAK
jgi:hypothetical protein